MAQKLRDIVVKTGEYQDRQTGQMKGRWQNVGSLVKFDDGNEAVILHRWFNPAGVPNPENRDSVILACFRPNRQQGQGQAPEGQQRQAPPQGQQPPQQTQGAPQGQPNAYGPPPQQGQNGGPAPGAYDDFDDEIPFAPMHPMQGG